MKSLGWEIPGNFPFPGKREGNFLGLENSRVTGNFRFLGIPISREFPYLGKLPWHGNSWGIGIPVEWEFPKPREFPGNRNSLRHGKFPSHGNSHAMEISQTTGISWEIGTNDSSACCWRERAFLSAICNPVMCTHCLVAATRIWDNTNMHQWACAWWSRLWVVCVCIEHGVVA